MKYKSKVSQKTGNITQENSLELEGDAEDIANLLSYLEFMNKPSDEMLEVEDELVKH